MIYVYFEIMMKFIEEIVCKFIFFNINVNIWFIE